MEVQLNVPLIICLVGIALIFIGLIGGGGSFGNIKVPEIRPFGRLLVILFGIVVTYIALISLGLLPTVFPQNRLFTVLAGKRGSITIIDQLSVYQSRETVDVMIDGNKVGTMDLDRSKGVTSTSILVALTGDTLHYSLKGSEVDTRNGDAKARIITGSGSIDPTPDATYEFQPLSWSDTGVVEYIRKKP